MVVERVDDGSFGRYEFRSGKGKAPDEVMK